ncbi:DUF6473 family protein [Seohaeicola saemankumensis]|uniref:DUF6473 family protein n=1 Tax=Seohaeicola saemankumensis TaxID=481181 RepID=UPI001E60E124|nr:DUF6473 family protein [Seohaeicola saemankumensis]MCD1626811.1 DUF6473 family protein [Seohaeicola saemankumensis]
MTFDTTGRAGLDYLPCRYGRSRLHFRGPRRSLIGDYALFLGGSETFGRFIEKPFPALLEAETGITCVNFGWQNAGVDVFLNDPTVVDVAEKARVTVVQVMGAQNMSNRFYTVHSRRNDRFLNASGLMKQMFRDVDFTEYAFNRHLLSSLRQLAPERYLMIRDELKSAWLSGMRHLLQAIGGRTILLWFSDHTPDRDKGLALVERARGEDLGQDPLFIDRSMLETLRPLVTALVEVTASPSALAQGTRGMVFSPLEAPAAAGMLGPLAHQEAVGQLRPVLTALWG